MNNQNHYKIFHKPILFLILIAFGAGWFCYHVMQTSLFPDVVFPKITIIADNGEQPVDKMMVTVTKPLEIAVKRVAGIQTVRSSTNRGSCTRLKSSLNRALTRSRTNFPPPQMLWLKLWGKAFIR
jgi:heavy metal efflux system protein